MRTRSRVKNTVISPPKHKTKKQILAQKKQKRNPPNAKNGKKKVKVSAQKSDKDKSRGKSKNQKTRHSDKLQPRKSTRSNNLNSKPDTSRRNTTSIPKETKKSSPKRNSDVSIPKNQKKQVAKKTKSNEKQKVKPQLPKGKRGRKDQQQQVKTVKPLSPVKQKAQKPVQQKVIIKGSIPIDPHFYGDKNVHVLVQGGKVYSATLNQTNVRNNNNKFYILQILQSDSNPNACYFFTRWGRVGVDGQRAVSGPIPMNSAIMQYNAKHRDKYHNGDYREVDINFEQQQQKKQSKDDKSGNIGDNSENKNDNKNDFETSKLPTSVKKLIQLIFDVNIMNKQMKQIGYDIKKMPLGKLSKESIKKGYNIIKQLDDEINGKNRTQTIQHLSNEFYSYIPHDFGFQKMSNFILRTDKQVKQKLKMLQALGQIKIATNILSQDKDSDNKLDDNYKKLHRDIEPIDKDSPEYEIIDKYLQSTHAASHRSYGLDLKDLFFVNDQRQNIRFTKDIPNKMLLWHGSRVTNYVGILSQGLRIAPPQAPVTGYMFGKGVYFADMSSKSANYCFTNRQNPEGILLLCEVALGKMNPKYHADYYAANLPDGYHSTKGLGRTAPEQKNYTQIRNMTIPMGPGEQTDIAGCSLMYNQYIVYDVAQIRIKYILRCKFNYC